MKRAPKNTLTVILYVLYVDAFISQSYFAFRGASGLELLESASSGRLKNCRFWHICVGLIFQPWRLLFGPKVKMTSCCFKDVICWTISWLGAETSWSLLVVWQPLVDDPKVVSIQILVINKQISMKDNCSLWVLFLKFISLRYETEITKRSCCDLASWIC